MRELVQRYGSYVPFVASVAGYLLGYELLQQLAGPAVPAFAVVPIVIAAWSFRPQVAVALSILVAVGALQHVGTASDSVAEPGQTVVVTLGFTFVGAVLSYARQSQRSVARLLATDQATGLLNRAAFLGVLQAKLQTGNPVRSDLVVIDIIHFRQVTETFGHEIGDELLRAIGQRLRDNAEGEDRVARIGSDKFLIWLRAGASTHQTGEAVLAVMAEPFKVARTEVRLESRVAIARYPDHATSAEELVRRAEIALDEAKAKGRSAVVATARTEQERLSRLETFAGLRAAIANGELRLHYQPIVELPGTNLRGVEALVRWQHPERGLLAPGEFIPVAEQSGLIVPLTVWVLNEALRQSRAWTQDGLSIRVAVNVGAKALVPSVSLAKTLKGLLDTYGVDPDLVALEITESDVMTDPERAIECLRELKALGVRIEVDDFGTGYSSLSYLQRLPLDAVKIDRSFITPLFVDAGTSAIVRAAIELSHALGLETIAEGVEDQAVVEMLAAMGCDFAQGYVFARPMPADKIMVWVASHSQAIAPRPALAVVETVSRGMPGRTVLIVDDEHPFRISAHRILAAQGFTVLHAATASEALRQCATHHGDIDLVLTDLFLTDWQGHKLAAHLRDLYPALRVMFMSGDPSGSQLAGGAAFLAKPFSRQELVTGVTGALAS